MSPPRPRSWRSTPRAAAVNSGTTRTPSPSTPAVDSDGNIFYQTLANDLVSLTEGSKLRLDLFAA